MRRENAPSISNATSPYRPLCLDRLLVASVTFVISSSPMGRTPPFWPSFLREIINAAASAVYLTHLPFRPPHFKTIPVPGTKLTYLSFLTLHSLVLTPSSFPENTFDYSVYLQPGPLWPLQRSSCPPVFLGLRFHPSEVRASVHTNFLNLLLLSPFIRTPNRSRMHPIIVTLLPANGLNGRLPSSWSTGCSLTPSDFMGGTSSFHPSDFIFTHNLPGIMPSLNSSDFMGAGDPLTPTVFLTPIGLHGRLL